MPTMSIAFFLPSPLWGEGSGVRGGPKDRTSPPQSTAPHPSPLSPKGRGGSVVRIIAKSPRSCKIGITESALEVRTMPAAPLDQLLASLTEAQRAAVTHIDGPLLVLAGPGS